MRLPRLTKAAICPMLAAFALASAASAQTLQLDRLPREQLDVTPPSARVLGEPGRMRIAAGGACPAAADASLRRRIVDVVVQEWGFFGFNVVDETVVEDDDDDDRDRRRRGSWRRFSWLGEAESARVAGSIAGYWSVTADGGWILDRQNTVWNGPQGVGARWRDPWSAAFVSWVMCASGLDTEAEFRRHIAHYVYIDQAIEARDDPDSTAAYVAHDVGEREVEPGDMLCRIRRSAYRTIAERRRDIGVGVRSHCDIVVKVEAESDRVLAIGGNVRGTVSLKLLPAAFEQREGASVARWIGRGRDATFAHLKLRAAPVEAGAFESTPTLRALSRQGRSIEALEQRLLGDGPRQASTPASAGETS